MKSQILILIFTLLIFSCSSDDIVSPETKTETETETETGTGTGTDSLTNGNLIVKNGKLCDTLGNPVQLRGVSTHGIQYFDEFYKDEKMFQALASSDGWDADVVRISLYAREGGYEDDPVYYTEQMDRLINSVTDNGMFAIIDWHQLHPGDPNLDKANAKKFFTHMAKKHGSNKDVIFEICNEPNNSGAFDEDWNLSQLNYIVTWDYHIKPYAEEIIPIIRKYSKNVIIVGTPEWGSKPDDVIGNKIDDPHVMYSMHFYAGSHFSDMRSNLERAIDADLPLFITEFGSQNYAGEGANNFYETEQWLDLLDEHSISWCNWNYSNDWRSGAIFKTYENSSDSAMIARLEGNWEDMSEADSTYLRNAPAVTFNSVEDYYDESKMKEAGIWIKNKIRNR